MGNIWFISIKSVKVAAKAKNIVSRQNKEVLFCHETHFYSVRGKIVGIRRVYFFLLDFIIS